LSSIIIIESVAGCNELPQSKLLRSEAIEKRVEATVLSFEEAVVGIVFGS
jgi:hypothetical protein